MQVGEALKRLREVKNIPQKDLAEKANISQTQLSLIEAGKSLGSIKTLTKLCDCLETPLAIMLWMALETKDIQENKQGAFNMMKPSVDALLATLHE
jgi:transcriptional regulator with XRE-family HTH domain